MNKELNTGDPVAYMSEETLKHCLEGNEICVRQNDELDDDCTIPLYTHPVKEPTEDWQYIAQRLNSVIKQKETEIEALKAEIVSIEKNTDYWADKANWVKNNKPVAKVTEHGIYLEYPFGLNLKIGTLLYTHPVKELTDEEIEEVIRKHWNKQYGSRNMLTLCKAVLKEEQEQ